VFTIEIWHYDSYNVSRITKQKNPQYSITDWDIEEEQTTQWPKEKVQKDKQRSTKHTCKTKDRVTQIYISLVVCK
jgi:hypothetical protein